MPRLHSPCELTFWQLKCLLHWNLSHSTALEKWRSHPLYYLLISQFQIDLGFQVKCRPHWAYGHLVRRIWIYRFQVMDLKAQRLEKLVKRRERNRDNWGKREIVGPQAKGNFSKITKIKEKHFSILPNSCWVFQNYKFSVSQHFPWCWCMYVNYALLRPLLRQDFT